MKFQKRWAAFAIITMAYSALAPLEYRYWASSGLLIISKKFIKPLPLPEKLIADLENWDTKIGRDFELASRKAAIELIPGLGNSQKPLLLGAAGLARVVARPAANQVLWIQTFSPTELGAPVISGDILLGAVDLIIENYARVRLIWSSQSPVAVRTMRPVHSFQSLQRDLKYWLEEARALEKEEVIAKIEDLLKTIDVSNAPWLSCSKGLLIGGVGYTSHELRGIDFNYFWPDMYGPQSQQAIISAGDELVTSGLDGQFPEGLRVARVIRITRSHSGHTICDIEAQPLILPTEVHWVWTLPSISKFLKGTEKSKGTNSF